LVYSALRQHISQINSGNISIKKLRTNKKTKNK